MTDLETVRDVCDACGIVLVEDCAHTRGARWAGRNCGTWGKIGHFSTRTYKHINSGEGGLPRLQRCVEIRLSGECLHESTPTPADPD